MSQMASHYSQRTGVYLLPAGGVAPDGRGLSVGNAGTDISSMAVELPLALSLAGQLWRVSR